MSQDLSILVIEDDSTVCEEFVSESEDMPSIHILAITNNSYRAIELIQNSCPDVVILDLELTQGKGNGLLFLQSLAEISLPFKPYILVTTNNTSSTTYEYARTLGADFIMSKHQEDYSEKSVLNFLVMMKDIIQQGKNVPQTSIQIAEDQQQYQSRFSKAIQIHLDAVGISPKMVGYRYLTEAIILVASGETNNFSRILGEKYKKTDASIQRAMQNAINKAWRSSDIEDLLEHYTARISSEKGVPTVTEFIHYYSNLISVGLK